MYKKIEFFRYLQKKLIRQSLSNNSNSLFENTSFKQKNSFVNSFSNIKISNFSLIINYFRRVIIVTFNTFAKKIIYHESIKFQRCSFFLSLTNNMFESLNSIIQIIINRIIQSTLQIYIINLLLSQRDERDKREKLKKSKANNQNNINNVNNNNRWNVINFNFYNSFYDKKFVTFKTFLIEHFDKNSYFRDIYIFIDKIIELIVIKKIKMIKKNL